MATTSINGDSADEINDPGAAPYGNFINYYTFNPPENRLSLIPATLLQDLGFSDGHQTTLILDVGCNSGVRGTHSTQECSFIVFMLTILTWILPIFIFLLV